MCLMGSYTGPSGSQGFFQFRYTGHLGKAGRIHAVMFLAPLGFAGCHDYDDDDGVVVVMVKSL